jgi:hypothetical protein
MLTLFTAIGGLVVDLAIIVAAGFAAMCLTGKVIGELSRAGNREFWNGQAKRIWIAGAVGGGWAAYSLYSLTLISAVLSVLGFLAVACIPAFIIIQRVDEKIYDWENAF